MSTYAANLYVIRCYDGHSLLIHVYTYCQGLHFGSVIDRCVHALIVMLNKDGCIEFKPFVSSTICTPFFYQLVLLPFFCNENGPGTFP